MCKLSNRKIIFDLKFSVLIPTWNGGHVLGETLRSLLSQSFNNFEVIINDDCSTDNTIDVAQGFDDDRIRIFRNDKNLGYPGNLEAARQYAGGDIIYLLAQDDILGIDALLKTYNAFKLSDDIGAVTRPFFQFFNDVDDMTPVRGKPQLNPDKDEIVTINDDPERVIAVFWSVDQLTALAYRREFFDIPFHPDVFPCHIYPFASIMKKHPVVYLKDYVAATRITSSQARHVSNIYNKSPMESWVEMFENVFREPKFKNVREKCIKDFVAKNYVGLVQIRNYGTYRQLLKEIYMLVRYRPVNIFNPGFLFFSLGTMIMPPSILIPMVDFYKNKIHKKTMCHVKFNHALKEL